MFRWAAAAAALAILAHSALAQQECTETFTSAATTDPSLSLLTLAVSSLGNGSTSLLPSPLLNITIFAPTDDAFFGLLQASGLSLTELSTEQNKVIAILLQHIVLNNKPLAELVAGRTAQSALGVIKNASYPLTFAQSGDTVTVKAKGNTKAASVINTIPVCGSFLHSVDTALLPVADFTRVPDVTQAEVAAAVAAAPGSEAAAAAAASSSTSATPTAAPTSVDAAPTPGSAMRTSLALLQPAVALLAAGLLLAY